MVNGKLLVFLTVFLALAFGASATQVVFNYCPITLNASTEAIMTHSISNNDTSLRFGCVHIAGSNVVLDCNGTTIEYGYSPVNASTDNIGANISDGTAINASNVINVNITNCRFNDINATGGSSSSDFSTGAINFTSVHNFIINNSIIRTNGTNYSNGIVLWNSTNGTVQNTTFHIQANNGSGSYAIFAHLNYTNLLIQGNHIFTNGSSGNNTALFFRGQGSNLTIYNNSITSNGTLSDNYGIFINGSTRCEPGACATATSNGNISNNTIRTMGAGNSTAISFERGVMNFTVTNNFLFPNGTNGDNYGIFLSTAQFNNITNNSITSYGFGWNVGIFLRNNSNHNLLGNNTINTFLSRNRENIGVFLSTILENNTIVRNYIRTDGTINNTGIVLTARANNNTIINNTIHANGTAGFNSGILLANLVSGNQIYSNTIETRGVGNNTGIQLDLLVNNTLIANNTVTTHGNESGMHGLVLRLTTVNNTVANNTFRANGTNISHAVFLQTTANNNTFNRNTYVALNGTSHSMFLETSSDNTFANDTLNSSLWIFQSGSNTQNLTNTTFVTGNGSIRFTSLVVLNASIWNITPSVINVSYNQTYVNSSNLSHPNATGFNTTARVTMLGINFTNPEPYFEGNDNTSFTKCSGSVCTEVSFSNGVYVFDVTHFSSYAALDEPSTTTGGGSGSSSSGSSGGSASAATTTSMTSQSMTTQGMKANDKVSFSVNNVQHTMTVGQVTTTTVTVRVASTPQTFVLKKGAVQEVNLDSTPGSDLRITVLDIFQSKATFFIEKILPPKVQTPVASSTPASTPAPSGVTPSAPASAPPAVTPVPASRAPAQPELVVPEPKKASGVWLPIVLIAVLVIAGIALLKGQMKKAMK